MAWKKFKIANQNEREGKSREAKEMNIKGRTRK